MNFLSTLSTKAKAGLLAFSFALSAPFVSSMAMAQTIDVAGATGALGEVATAVALIGAAMVLAISAGIAYRWVVAFLAK